MKKILFLFGFILFCAAVWGQTPYDTVNIYDPQNFTEMTTMDVGNFQFIGRKNSLNRRMHPDTLRKWITPDVLQAWAGDPFDSIDVNSAYWDQFVTDSLGRVWFVDSDGDAKMLKDTASVVVDTDNQTIDTFSLSGSIIRLSLEDDGEAAKQINISAYAQTLSLSGDTLTISGTGSSVILPSSGGGITGTGQAGKTTYWDTDTTLAYTAITYSATEWNAGALTGAVGLASGTTAQRPTGAAGKMRYNSDLSDLEFYNGTAWRSLAESSANAFTAGEAIIANPAGILTDTTIAAILSMGGAPTGSGTSGTIPIWSGTDTLGNSSLTESGQVLSSSLTGAFKLPAGTDAEDPVWAAGMLRYNTTAGGFQGYNTAERFLPWADADNWAVNRIPFSDGNQLTSSSTFIWDGDQLGVNTSTLNQALAVNGNIRVRDAAGTGAGTIYLDASSTVKTYISTAGGIRISAGDASTTNVNFAYGNTVHGRFAMTGTIATAVMEAQNFAGYQDGDVTVKGKDPVSAASNHIIIRGGYGSTTTNTGGNTYIRSGYVNPSFFTDYGGVPGNVYIQAYADSNATVTSPLYTAMYIPYVASGVGKASVSMFGTFAPTSNLDINGKIRFRMLPDSIYAYEVRADVNGRLSRASGSFVGAISTSTDGSGDIVVAHGMASTPTSIQVTVTGTTPYVVTVHTIDGTNFTVRFFDMAGAAVASTAVTATWLAKT